MAKMPKADKIIPTTRVAVPAAVGTRKAETGPLEGVAVIIIEAVETCVAVSVGDSVPVGSHVGVSVGGSRVKVAVADGPMMSFWPI